MTDIATLGLRVDSRQLAQGTQALDRLGDQATMTERQVVQSGARMTTSVAQTSRAMRLLGVNAQQAQQGMRMLPFQLNQMAQMGQVTGNWMQAVSIQLPDILQGFGTMRLVMAGTAVGLAASLIPSLVQATGILGDLRKDTRSTTDRVDDLASAFKNLQQAQDLARGSTDSLIERYGVVSEQILRIVDGLEQAALTGFQTATREAVVGFQEMESAVGDALGMLQTIEAVGGNRVRGLAARFEELPPPVREAAEAVQNFATSGQEELLVQRDRALEAAEALQSLNDPAYGEAIQNLLGFADVASQALGRIREEAGVTAGALSALSGGVSGPDAAIAQIRESGTGLGAPLTGVVSRWRSPAASSRGGGGGGGGGGGRSGAEEITAEMRAADQAIRQAQEAAVQFGDVQAVLNERLASGAIDLATYNSALEMAREKYTEVGEGAQFWESQMQSLKDGILDAIVNGEDLADTFEGIAKSIARAALEAALFGSGPLAGGGGGGGLLGSLFGGLFAPRAAGGPVTAGVPYVVGERRPELFVPNQSGRIVPQVGGSGEVVVRLDVPEGVTVQETQQIAGEIAVRVVADNTRRQAQAQRRRNGG